MDRELRSFGERPEDEFFDIELEEGSALLEGSSASEAYTPEYFYRAKELIDFLLEKTGDVRVHAADDDDFTYELLSDAGKEVYNNELARDMHTFGGLLRFLKGDTINLEPEIGNTYRITQGR